MLAAIAIGISVAGSVRLNDDVEVIAHRGASHAAPENTLAFDGGWEYDPAPESIDHIKVKKRYGLFIDGDVLVTVVTLPIVALPPILTVRFSIVS